MTSPKPTVSTLAPLPRPPDVARRREDAVRAMLDGTANRLLYVSSYASGLVTLREADGTVIDSPIAWVGVFAPQTGDACVRIALPGRGSRDAAASYVAFGPVHKADDGPGVVVREGSASTGAAVSTTSTSTYSVAQTVQVPLGPGLWDVVCEGSVLVTHSASGQADVQVTIDGTATSRQSPALSTTVYGRVGSSRRSSGVAGNRTISCTVEFKCSTAGTVQSRNPNLRVSATRVG